MLFMKTLPILIGFSAFPMRVASINNDRELYDLDLDFDKHCTPEKSTNFVQNQKKILSQ